MNQQNQPMVVDRRLLDSVQEQAMTPGKVIMVPETVLPTVAEARKNVPLFSGVMRYFPDALVAVAELSMKGNQQHNPGTPLHWDRSKSGDEADALARHLLESGTIDTDGVRHSAKVAWRALALLQKEIEAARGIQKE